MMNDLRATGRPPPAGVPLRLFTSLVLALFLGWSPPSFAQQFSGNFLYEACLSDDRVQNSFCIGYLTGAVEGGSFGAFVAMKQGGLSLGDQSVSDRINYLLGHCIPANASNEQLLDVVMRYLKENPENRHAPARGLIWLAMVHAFPCK